MWKYAARCASVFYDLFWLLTEVPNYEAKIKQKDLDKVKFWKETVICKVAILYSLFSYKQCFLNIC